MVPVLLVIHSENEFIHFLFLPREIKYFCVLQIRAIQDLRDLKVLNELS